MSVRKIVIDASVALKWRLSDEDAIAEATCLLKDFLAGQIELMTPTLFDYEVTNALKVAMTRNRINQPDAAIAVAGMRALNIKRHDFHPIQDLAFQLAYQYQRSVYDAAYIALAQSNQLDFFTGDKRLFNAVSNALSWVKWIGDY